MDNSDHDGTSDYASESKKILRKPKLIFGDVGELELGLKRIKGQATVGGLELGGEYKYNGEWKAKASTPLFGGIAEGETNSAGDWQVKMAKPLFGGELGIDAREHNGHRRYYVEYKKTY